jgi:hypothetical protein
MKGPVPLALRTAKFSSLFLKSWGFTTLFCSDHSLSIIMVLVRLFTSRGLGPLVFTRTVRSSTLETLSMEVSSPFMSEVGAMARWRENTTSSAVKGLPLWNLTPSRSLNSHTEGSSGRVRHEVANVGTKSPFRSRSTRGSYIW